MRLSFLILFILFTGGFLSSCSHQKSPPAVSFYYWKSTFSLSQSESDWLRDQQVERIYVKYFDVDIENGKAIPKAPITFKDSAYHDYEIVPCVFITNRTFKAAINPESLAEKVWGFVADINDTYNLSPSTYQLDCDWSPSTRSNYFRFLKRLDQLAGEQSLTATIRLHQLRYPEQTGVPPVDRGVLMYYNMGDIQDVEEPNSILNTSTAASYLESNMKYDLPLDYALPVFSWVLAYRLGELHAIINQSNCNELDTLSAAQSIAPSRYKMQQNTYFGNHYLNQGDILRCEMPSMADLETAIDQLSMIDNESDYLLFYHLDENLSHVFPKNLPKRLAERLHTR